LKLELELSPKLDASCGWTQFACNLISAEIFILIERGPIMLGRNTNRGGDTKVMESRSAVLGSHSGSYGDYEKIGQENVLKL